MSSVKNKEFCILVWKTNFLNFCETDKALHFRCVLNTTMLLFILAQLRALKKLMRVLVCAGNYTEKHCGFIFASRCDLQ